MAHLTRLKILKRFLEELPEENFRWSSVNTVSQDKTPESCGTKACIAGWSHYLFGPKTNDWDDTMPELDITIEESRFLCYAYGWKDFPPLPTFGPMEEAIRRVDAVIKHYEGKS